jgi:hypothetical protein
LSRRYGSERHYNKSIDVSCAHMHMKAAAKADACMPAYFLTKAEAQPHRTPLQPNVTAL